MVTLRSFLLNQYKEQKKNNIGINMMDCIGRFGYLCRTKFDFELALEELNNVKLKRTQITEDILREAYADTDIIKAIIDSRGVKTLFYYDSIKGCDIVSIINSYADVYKKNKRYYFADFYFKRNNMYISKDAYYFIRYNIYKDILFLVRDDKKSPKNINNKRKISIK